MTAQSASLASDDTDRKKARSGFARRLPLLGAVAVALAAAVGWQIWTRTRPYEWSGTVEARTISVGSRVGGRVKAIHVREGDRVAEGQPLLELEPADLPAQRLMAAGELDQARANLDKLKRGARPEEIEQADARAQTATAALEESRVGARTEQVAASKARLVAAQVTVDKAKLDADRAEKLFVTQSISQGQLDDARATLNGAIAQRDAAKQALDELQNGSRREDIAQASARAAEAQASAHLVAAGSRVEDIEAGKAAVDAAQGKLDQIDVLIDELVIRAPRASRVESLDLRPGDILAPNATAATLIEDDQLYVRIYVPETQIGHIHPGQDVPISVDSFPHRDVPRRRRAHQRRRASTRRATCRPPTSAPTRSSRRASGFAKAQGDLRAGMAAFIHVAK